MSDTRFKKLLAGTDQLPLVNPEEVTDNPFPKFEQVISNAIGNIKDEQGKTLLDYKEDSIRGRDERERRISPDTRRFADDGKGAQNKSEDIPEPFKSLFPEPSIRKSYKYQDEFNKSKEDIDRLELDQEMVKALVEKQNPTMATNMKNYPFDKDQNDVADIKNLAAGILEKKNYEIPDFESGPLNNVYGLYDDATDKITLRDNKEDAKLKRISTYLHELSHKENDKNRIHNPREQLLDFSQGNYPGKVSKSNNFHSYTNAPLTKEAIEASEDLGGQAKFLRQGELQGQGQQYNLFEAMMKHLKGQK